MIKVPPAPLTMAGTLITRQRSPETCPATVTVRPGLATSIDVTDEGRVLIPVGVGPRSMPPGWTTCWRLPPFGSHQTANPFCSISPAFGYEPEAAAAATCCT